ncbi:MAG: hypothetical protein WDW38_002034 [Sanguina aurantia]
MYQRTQSGTQRETQRARAEGLDGQDCDLESHLQSGSGSGGVFKSAALEVLRKQERLMTSGDITKRAQERRLLKVTGLTPENTMASALYTDVRKRPTTTPFIKPKEGLFGLKAWLNEPWLLNWLVTEDIQMSDFLSSDMAASNPQQELLRKRTRLSNSGRDPMDTGNPEEDEGDSGSDPMTVSPPDHLANLQLLLDAADEIDRESPADDARMELQARFDPGPARDQDRAMDSVFEFADIAGPSPIPRSRRVSARKAVEGYTTEESDEEEEADKCGEQRRYRHADRTPSTSALTGRRATGTRGSDTPALTGRTSRPVDARPRQQRQQRESAANFASTAAQRSQLLSNAQELMGGGPPPRVSNGGGGSGGALGQRHSPARTDRQPSLGAPSIGLQLGGGHRFPHSAAEGRSNVLDLNRPSMDGRGGHLDLSCMDLGSGSTSISPHQQQQQQQQQRHRGPWCRAHDATTPGIGRLDAAAWGTLNTLQRSHSQHRNRSDSGRRRSPGRGFMATAAGGGGGGSSAGESAPAPHQRPPNRSWDGLPTSPPSPPSLTTARAPRASLSSLHLSQRPSAWELLSRDPVNPQVRFDHPLPTTELLLPPSQEHGAEDGLHLGDPPAFSRFSSSGAHWRQQQQQQQQQQTGPPPPRASWSSRWRRASPHLAPVAASDVAERSHRQRGERQALGIAAECGHSSGDSEGAVLTLDFGSRASCAATAPAAPTLENPASAPEAAAAAAPAPEPDGPGGPDAEGFMDARGGASAAAVSRLQAGEAVVCVDEAGPGDVPDPAALNKIRAHVLEIEGRHGRAHPETGKAWLMLARVLEHHCTRWSLRQGERALLSAWEVVSAVQAEADPRSLPQSFPQFIFLLEQMRMKMGLVALGQQLQREQQDPSAPQPQAPPPTQIKLELQHTNQSRQQQQQQQQQQQLSPELCRLFEPHIRPVLEGSSRSVPPQGDPGAPNMQSTAHGAAASQQLQLQPPSLTHSQEDHACGPAPPPLDAAHPGPDCKLSLQL